MSWTGKDGQQLDNATVDGDEGHGPLLAAGHSQDRAQCAINRSPSPLLTHYPPRLRQILRATKCDKLSDRDNLNAIAGYHHNWLDVCSPPDIACRLYTIVLSQHHTHEQDDPDRATLSTQPLTAHTGNLRHSGEVHVRFFVARVGGRMPDHTWHRASTFSIGQPPGRRARDTPPGTLSAPGAPPPPGSGGRAAVLRDVGWCWDRRRRMGEGSAAGVPWGDGRGKGDVGRLGGAIANGMAHAQTGEIPSAARTSLLRPRATS
jgi:hypothetical protein